MTDPQDFRRWAHEAADWSADYLDTVAERPVRAQVAPGEVFRQLPSAPPHRGEAMEAIFADLDRIVMPGMTHWQHPRFFAYFPANSSPPSVVAEFVTAALAAQCMLWQTSPAATELETRVLDWLRQMIGLGEGFSGVIQDSASGATLAAILTARERVLGLAGNRDGLAAHPPVRVYASAHVHSSIDKAVRVAGIGDANLVRIPVRGDRFAMDPDALDQRDRCRSRGRFPSRRRHRLHRRHQHRRLRRRRVGRRGRAPARPLPARRCGVGRKRDDLPRVPPPDARRRPGRQLRLQPAQMAVHEFRLLGAFREGPERAHRHARHPPALPQNAWEGGLRRLQRLVAAARPAFSRPQALVRHSLLRRRGPAGDDPPACRLGRGAGGAGRRRSGASSS